MKVLINRTENEEQQKYSLFSARQNGFICMFLTATFETKQTLEGTQLKRWSPPVRRHFRTFHKCQHLSAGWTWHFKTALPLLPRQSLAEGLVMAEGEIYSTTGLWTLLVEALEIHKTIKKFSLHGYSWFSFRAGAQTAHALYRCNPTNI